jgi:hypothetical protein
MPDVLRSVAKLLIELYADPVTLRSRLRYFVSSGVIFVRSPWSTCRSMISYHMALSTAKARASPVPNIQLKYHISNHPRVPVRPRR